MRTLKVWLLVLALHGLAPNAAAQETYIAASAGRTSWDLDCGPNGCQRNSTAWRAAAGVRFNRVVALEAYYFDLGRARSSDFLIDGSLGATGIGVHTLLGWRSEEFDIAGKIGLADMRNEFRAAPTSLYSSSRVHRTELVGGLMAAYRVTPSVAVRLDVDILTVALDGDALFYSRGADVRVAMLGVMFRF